MSQPTRGRNGMTAQMRVHTRQNDELTGPFWGNFGLDASAEFGRDTEFGSGPAVINHVLGLACDSPCKQ